MPTPIPGACLCGAVRYQVEPPSRFVCHCHCSQCRRAHGAAFATWAGFPLTAFTLLDGAARVTRYETPETGARSFCSACGSQLFFEDPRWPGEVHVTVATLAAPPDRPPKVHVFFDDRCAFVELRDGLPRAGGEDGTTALAEPDFELVPLAGGPEDVAAVARVLAGAPGYSVRVAGGPPAPEDAADLFTALPPGREPGHKEVLGIRRRGGGLVGVIDAVAGYPVPETTVLGLLLLMESEQGRGLGRAAYRAFEHRVRARGGCRRLRLGVVETNRGVLGFWEAQGFVPTGEVKPFESKAVRTRVMVLEKALAP